MLDNKVILVTGGTGSFGGAFVKKVLHKYKPKKIIVYSRDEYKQYIMQQSFKGYEDQIRFLLGDVRDKIRLHRALEGVDYVIHAAALKQVPALEYNPIEAIKTNIGGAENVIEASIDTGVKKVISLSTDKAVNPINLYGATKLVAEKLFVSGNTYGGGRVKFSSVRYGNVIASRGSIIPLFMDLRKNNIKEFPITDERMTRFWISLDQSVDLVLKAIGISQGGEIFVPIIPSMKVVDLAKAIYFDCELKIIGIRPGEKLHESLISSNESGNVKCVDNMYVILPNSSFFRSDWFQEYEKFPGVASGFSFESNKNDRWLNVEDLENIIESIKIE